MLNRFCNRKQAYMEKEKEEGINGAREWRLPVYMS